MTDSKTCNIVVLISGSGSNLQAIIDDLAGHPKAHICAVVSNRADAYGLIRAEKAGITRHVLNHKDFADRLAFDTALMQVIDQHQPDLVVLAGFMRILTPEFTRHYAHRLLNIHPSLLPKHKGLNTHQRAIDAGDHQHGCSVHFVTEELDGGPVVIQAALPIQSNDTAEQLAQRVHALEHQIYPLAVRWFADGRLQLSEQGALLDQQPLANSGYQFQP
ncbi:phosphoribosylglycinamide formyltransferase [Denitrificimonas sp. JX-1]|uniref:Phosphoribosylglycinamide formyltransferase n=1 Tax=Denitrificimonas halotolerans TaxID=3098930 RepID=A0ABU5GPQ3_9GAMM|nr:phosphoribosylglycinamide formyltransferase [Denitrificimonas sp. JX-1]MDY7218977.1 phosphoribosylglycinamide formyltransferase [Denitrificimonas sp. JX-1]